MRILPINYNRNIYSFCGGSGKKTPVYIIDKEGGYKKFGSVREAAEFVGKDKSCLSGVLSDKCANLTAGGYIVRYADDVEIKTNDGRIIPDENRIKQIANEVTKRKTTKGTPVYAIKTDGTYRKYTSEANAAQATNTKRSNLSNHLHRKSRSKTLNGYIFVPPEAVETKDNNGKIIVDESKIDAIINERTTRKQREKEPVYEIYPNRVFNKFASIDDASTYTGIRADIIRNSVLYKKRKETIADSIFVRAKEIETKNPDGTIQIDESKLNAAIEDRTSKRNGAVYTVDKFGTIKRYDSSSDAEKEANCWHSAAARCLDGKLNTTNGFAFFRAEEYEEIKNTSDILTNKDKLLKDAKKRFKGGWEGILI